jgi:WD40 repeat protein
MVLSAVFAPDGKSLLTGSGKLLYWRSPGSARLWEVPRGTPSTVPDVAGLQAFAWKGKIRLERRRRSIVLWQTATGERIGEFRPPTPLDWLDAAGVTADGKTALVVADDHEIFFLDVAARKFDEKPVQYLQRMTALALSPDGRGFLTGCDDGTVQLWDLATRTPVGPVFRHEGRITALAFSSDGRRVLAGSRDETVRLWDLATRWPIGPALRHPGPVETVAFDPDDRTFLTAAGETRRVWNVPTPVQGEHKRLDLWSQVLTGLELDDNGAVRLLDAPTWQERRRRLAQQGGPPIP